MRLYFDTNIFIYAMETDYDHGLRARRCLHQIERREIDAVTRELTLAESLRGGNAPLRPSVFKSYIDLIVSGPSLLVMPVSREILIESARLNVGRSIELADAIHVSTALAAKCDGFLTEDKRAPVPASLRKVSLAEWITDL